jgi:hypothetical protein
MLFKAKSKAKAKTQIHLDPTHKHLFADKAAKAAAPQLTAEQVRQAVGHWLLDNGLTHLYAYAASAAGESGATFYVAIHDTSQPSTELVGTLLYHVESQSIVGFGGAFLPGAFPLYDHNAPVRSGYTARRAAMVAA